MKNTILMMMLLTVADRITALYINVHDIPSGTDGHADRHAVFVKALWSKSINNEGRPQIQYNTNRKGS